MARTYVAERRAYQDAKRRCRNRKRPDYPDYGGRGIEFRFTSFEEFIAEIGPKPSPEFVLDRENNDSHYMPGNVRWVTPTVSLDNRRAKRLRRPETHTAPLPRVGRHMNEAEISAAVNAWMSSRLG